MASNPKEYIHLPSGPNNNIAYFRHEMTQYWQCYGFIGFWNQGGTTKFSKVALDIQVNLINNLQ